MEVWNAFGVMTALATGKCQDLRGSPVHFMPTGLGAFPISDGVTHPVHLTVPDIRYRLPAADRQKRLLNLCDSPSKYSCVNHEE
jgi:hypothetical protein